jgi:hypothetical protein
MTVMLSKIVSFILFVAFATVALADESSADSARVFRQVCEKAMPDLLKRDFDSASTALSSISVASRKSDLQAFLASTKWKFQLANPAGEPIDWKYVGVKRLGDKLSQLTYVCRYSKQPIMWSFIAQKQDGRWALTGMHVDDLPANIVRSCGSDSEISDEPCRELCSEFVELLAHGKTEAVAFFQKNCTTAADADKTKSMVTATLMDISGYGSLLSSELVHARDWNGTLRSFTYLMQWDRNIATIDVYVYRPGKDWKFLGLSGDANLERIFADVPVKVNSRHGDVQTAQEQSSKSSVGQRYDTTDGEWQLPIAEKPHLPTVIGLGRNARSTAFRRNGSTLVLTKAVTTNATSSVPSIAVIMQRVTSPNIDEPIAPFSKQVCMHT